MEALAENQLAQDNPPVIDEVVDDVAVDTPENEETPEAVEPEEGDSPKEPTAEEEAEAQQAEVTEKKADAEPEVDSEIAKKLEKMEKRLGFLQRQNEKLIKDRTRQPEPEAIKDVTAPKSDDFESYEECQEALVDYKVQKGISEYQQKVQQTYQKSDLEGFIDETLQAGRDRYSDFSDVAESNTVPITQPMLEIMRDCENPESIAYYLGKNITECTAISRMSPIQAARAITQIENRVAAELQSNPTGTPTKKPLNKVSQAPPPVKPTGSGLIVDKDPEKMSQSEYEAWRAAGGGT